MHTPDDLKQKMKWVGKYISRPLLIIILILVCLYYLWPEFYSTLGIDIADLGKYSFWFFLIKGCLWIIIGIYAFVSIRGKKK